MPKRAQTRALPEEAESMLACLESKYLKQLDKYLSCRVMHVPLSKLLCRVQSIHVAPTCNPKDCV